MYLSWSQGSKSGGYDARSNKPPAARRHLRVPAERATTYELGVKTAVGHTAEINADVFYTEYKDLQTSAFDGAIGFNVGNGSAEVMGVEVQGRWRVTPELHAVSGLAAYLDFEWTNYNGQCYFGLRRSAGSQCTATATTTDSPTSWRRISPADSGRLPLAVGKTICAW